MYTQKHAQSFLDVDSLDDGLKQGLQYVVH